ncbi:MAG TPA: PDZ domain-containing protein [Pseudonocardiaceae bacterium]|nr:PDZ domain-containing protein [Pseudonocardiaceae bacterium]
MAEHGYRPARRGKRLLGLSAVIGVVVAGSVAVGISHAATGISFFVAPGGADTNAGTTASQPVATLGRAQQLVRAALPAATGPITVNVAGGTYYQSSPLAFGTADSGTAAAPVTWKATPGAVTISGGRRLTPTWQPVSAGSGIMQATVATGLHVDQLFVNGQRQILARFPNFDPTAPRLDGATTLANLNTESKKWASPATALIRTMHCNDWGSTSFTAAGSTPGALGLHYVGDSNRGQDCGLTVGGSGNVGPVMAENVREELDAPGEWYYNPANGQLLFWAPAGTNLSTAKIETAEQDELITVTGASAQNPVRNLTFDGFHFTETHRTLFDSTYEPDAKGDWAIVRKGAVYLRNAANVTVTNSFFDQLGGNGVFLDGFNDGDVISNNKFEFDGASDVQVVGSPDSVRDYSNNFHQTVLINDTAAGPKSDNYPRDVDIRNNLMENMGQFELQSSGVNISMSRNVTVDGNTIDGSARACLNIEDGTWGGHLIENNDIFDCVQHTGDNGSINVWGRGRFWAASGNNSLAPGTSFAGANGTQLNDAQAEQMMKLDVLAPITIQHNRFWHDGDWAIDLDDGSSNFVIRNNLILKGGIKLRDGFDRTVQNNVLVSGTMFEQISHANNGDVIQHNITLGPTAYNNVGSDPTSAKYTVDDNLFWNGGGTIAGPGSQLSANGTTINQQSSWVQAGMDVHSLVADPRFSSGDPTGQYDFTVATNSPAIGLGYANFPMTGFGAAGGPLPPKAVLPFGSGGTAPSLITQPEPLMGATATNIPSLAVQSALGLGQPIGLYLANVPAGTVAAQAGLLTGDDITAINGNSVTTDRNTFWQPYDKLAAGAAIMLTVRRVQTNLTINLAKTTAAEELNDTSGVGYTNTGSPGTGWIWRGTNAGGASSYQNDIWATQNVGDSWSLTFNGTGLDIISETNTDEGNVALTIDGTAFRTVSFVTSTRVFQSTVVSITGLAAGVHTVTGKMLSGSYMIVDAFRTHPG